MSSASLEAAISKSVQDGDLPGAVMAGQSLDGSINYLKAIGHRSLEDRSSPLQPSTPLTIASCTKLITTIAALQLVEKGRLSLSGSVLSALPELAALPILEGFTTSDEPILVPRKRDITLRHLLTHSSGCGYPGMSEKLLKYHVDRGERIPSDGDFMERLKRSPLCFEPGTAWEYGTSIDCAGVLVERTSGIDLDSWFRDRILKPLGLKPETLTFWPSKHSGMEALKAGMTVRDRPDAKVRHTKKDMLNHGAKVAFGGQGAIGEVPAYMTILRSLIDPQDERLLSTKMKDSMFTPHLDAQAEQSLNDMLAVSQAEGGQGAFIGSMPVDKVRLSWGLGGIIPCEALPKWRGKGTLVWGGLPNLMWLADKERGVCAMFGTQVLPPSDPRVGRLIKKFEMWLYQQVNEKEKSGKGKL